MAEYAEAQMMRAQNPYSEEKPMYPDRTSYPIDDRTAGRPATQVEDQSNALDKALASLSETTERLEEYLSKVLRPEIDGGPEMAVPEEMLVPMANCVRDWVKRVGRLDGRVRSLVNRLEL